MSAVDAGDVHAAPRQIEDLVRIARRFGSESHHDHAAAPLAPPEQLDAVSLEQALAAVEGTGARERRALARVGGERRDRSVQVGQHAGLEAAERRQSEQRELVLQITQVAAAQRQIVGEVGGADLEARRAMPRRQRSSVACPSAATSARSCRSVASSSKGERGRSVSGLSSRAEQSDIPASRIAALHLSEMLRISGPGKPTIHPSAKLRFRPGPKYSYGQHP